MNIARGACVGENVVQKTQRIRDHTIDYLRGLGCVMMIVAHMRFYDLDPDITLLNWVHFIGGLAPVFFFATSGVTSQMQSTRYSIKYIFLSSLFLFLLGLSYSTVIHPHLYSVLTLEIFQIIAVGGFIVAVVERYSKPSSFAYMLIAMAICASKWCFDSFYPGFDGAGILLLHNEFVPFDKGGESSSIVFPGFPILPWLFLFFAGCACYRLRNSSLLALVIFALGLHYLLNYQLGINTRWFSKWDTPVGYVILQVAALAGGILLSRYLARFKPGKYNVILYFGENSLLFLYAHSVGLAAGYLASYNQWIAWVSAVVVTFLMMKALQKIPLASFMQSLKSWVILAVIIALLPLSIFYSQNFTLIVVVIEAFLGLFMARNYNQLGSAIKRTLAA